MNNVSDTGNGQSEGVFRGRDWLGVGSKPERSDFKQMASIQLMPILSSISFSFDPWREASGPIKNSLSVNQRDRVICFELRQNLSFKYVAADGTANGKPGW